MYKVFRSEQYQKLFDTLDSSEQKRVEQCEENIQMKPYSSKPLGYRFLREKKFHGKRLLLLIYEKEELVVLATICTKKTQKKEIEIITSLFSWYKKQVEEILKGSF